MRAGVVQFQPEFGNIKRNLEKVLSMIASEEADLFVLPELALSGYIFESREEARAWPVWPATWGRLSCSASPRERASSSIIHRS